MRLLTTDLYLSKENPIKEIWDQLFLNITKEKLERTNTYSSKQLSHIKYLLTQSSEFFESAKNVSLKTNPLLQFYGCSNLVKVLILSKKFKPGIESLDQSHGLKFILDRSKINDLASYEVQILGNGTFIELLNLFDRKELISNLNSLKFNLKTLLRHYLDIFDYLEPGNEVMPIGGFKIKKMSNLSPQIVSVKIEKDYGLFIYLIGGDKKENFEKYKTKFGNIEFDNFLGLNMRMYPGDIPDHFPIVFLFNNFVDLPNFEVFKNYENQSFIISPIQKNELKILFYQIEIQYMISFIYSNLVRYYADVWEKVIDSFDFSWLIRKSIDYISRGFPNNILNNLINKNCIVLNPGLLTRQYNIDLIN